ncbi:MAG TPA: arylsulfotransferase family protein [Solirubrobacteraceae bacterium]|nr:arylsulfotransferase family protein [Solirubrobacteraceae bacterium]
MRRALIFCGALVAACSAGALAYASQRISAENAAYAAPAAPQCVPALLNRSAVLPGTSIAVSPLPGSYDASARTQISLLGAPASALSGVSASGSHSGAHPGRLIAYSQGDGASFVPSRAFDPGETVTVRGRVRSSTATAPFAYKFLVAHQDTLLYTTKATTTPTHDYNEEQHFHSAPTLQPPVLSATASSPQSAPGDIFAAPYSGPGPSGPEIFSQSGELVWFDPLAGETEATNLQVQQLYGKPVLTWWQGYIPPQGFGEGEEMIDNSSYQQVGRVHAGNGYKVDLHDFHITAQGTALLTMFNPIDCNLSAVGGPSGGAVTDSGFQEIDLATGLVRREWTSLDHIGLSDSYSSPEQASTAWPFDYFHINSIDQLPGSTALISARNTWALYELNTSTGQVVLQVGGKHGEVKALSGAATAFQHDATVLGNGTISVFDNGATPKVHPQSRAIVLSVNPQAKTDTLLAGYEHSSPQLSSSSQGSVQALANGDTFVGWGSEPYFSEFGSGGQLLYDAHWHGSYQSYRAYRFTWTGTPARPPAIAASAASPSAPVTVYASWNGATEVASWRVLAGPSPTRLTTVASAAKDGFETALVMPGPERYIAAQALNAAGAVLGTSPTIRG